MPGSNAGSESDDAQMVAIKAKQSKLAYQLFGYVVLSFMVAAAFYGTTILENPDLKPSQ